MNEYRYACSSCRKRVAVYKRVTSGERLCKLCLFRSLVKQTRKAIHYYKMVSRASPVLYVIRPEAVGESVVGFNVYRGATRDFELVYNVLCIDGFTDCSAVEKVLGEGVNKFEVVEVRHRPKDAIELIKLLESVAAKKAKGLAIKYVVTPLFRDELTAFSLLGVITTSRTVFSEGMPVKSVDEVKITRPFFYSISSDFAILKVLDGIDIGPELQLECSELMSKAKSMLYASPELMYSSIKSVELLQTYVFGSTTRCRYCGAFSTHDVCDICRAFQQLVDAIG